MDHTNSSIFVTRAGGSPIATSRKESNQKQQHDPSPILKSMIHQISSSRSSSLFLAAAALSSLLSCSSSSFSHPMVERPRPPPRSSSTTTSVLVTTTVYVSHKNGNALGIRENESLYYQSSPTTTGIFTSLGGEDDDNNNNNKNTPRRRSELWKTLAWFAFGSVLTIPMTEFIFDPLLLTWAMAFLGWLSSEEYDYPNHQYHIDYDHHRRRREEEEEVIDPVPAEEDAKEKEEIGQADEDRCHYYYYPGATDREYFMTREEVQAEEALLRQEQELMNSRSKTRRSSSTSYSSDSYSTSYYPTPSTMSVGGDDEAYSIIRTKKRNDGRVGFTMKLPRRRNLTFCGIQAAMIVLGDWMVRLLLGTVMVGGGDNSNAIIGETVRRKVVPSWLASFSFPLEIASIICSMVVHFRIIQMHSSTSTMRRGDDDGNDGDAEKSSRRGNNDAHQNPSATAVFGSSSSSSISNVTGGNNSKSDKVHPIPYWLGYYMDHMAILLPIALLIFEFLFESNWLWKNLTKLFSRHVAAAAAAAGGNSSSGGNHGGGSSFQPLLGRLNEMNHRPMKQ